jgi:adenylosuccinate lyase
LVVYPQKMEKDLEITRGLIFSEKVMLALVGKGASRQEAYVTVQRNALRAARGDGDFLEGLLHDQEVARLLTPEEIETCFDVQASLARAENVFARLEDMKVGP